MKKQILCILLIIITTISLIGCGKKEVISAKEFKETLEELNYIVVDISDHYEEDTHIKEAIIAQNLEENFQVEYYIFTDNKKAQRVFQRNKNNFENSKGFASLEQSTSIGSYSKYLLQSNGYYMCICRVDNTFFYAKVDKQYKEYVEDIMKAIGY